MSSYSELIAIGDIHGCAASTEMLLKTLEAKELDNPVYVFLGDYTDRGPNSRAVIDLLIKFGNNHECIFLRGNHDQMLLDAYEKNEWNLWLTNGGNTTLENYDSVAGNFKLPKSHYQFFKNTKLYWQTESYFFVHAGLNPELTISENLESDYETEQFLWQRAHINSVQTKWEKKVVFGHTPVKEPIIRENMIGIDTGCVYKSRGYGVLTAIILPEMEIIQQNSLDF